MFSPRPGTPAAALTDLFVPPEVARGRMERLVELVERHALDKHRARVGRVEDVVIEGPSKTDAAMWSGRSRQNKLVHFPIETIATADRTVQGGDTIDVEVTAAAPHWLRGDIVAIRPPARRRRIRIPIAAAP